MKQELTKFLAGFANSGKVSSYNTIKWYIYCYVIQRLLDPETLMISLESFKVIKDGG